jgi:hypothetical protein
MPMLTLFFVDRPISFMEEKSDYNVQ